MTRKLAFHCVNASLSLRFAIARMYRSARRTFASHLRVSAASFASRARFASTSSAHSMNAFATALRVMRCTHRATFLSRARSFRAASRHLWKARYSAWCEIEARNRLESPTFASHTALALIWRCQAKNVDDIASREIFATARLTNARWRRFSLARDTHPSNARASANLRARVRIFVAARVRRRDSRVVVDHDANARRNFRRMSARRNRSLRATRSRQSFASRSAFSRSRSAPSRHSKNASATRRRVIFAMTRARRRRKRRIRALSSNHASNARAVRASRNLATHARSFRPFLAREADHSLHAVNAPRASRCRAARANRAHVLAILSSRRRSALAARPSASLCAAVVVAHR